ncbi:MAG: CBS domain-containing protein [Chloroflexi bacterium]|nr:CBS domain-containing protein [Chloroflexota bacterium]
MDNSRLDDDISEEDLRAALKEAKEYIDITENDLKKIYIMARRHARERLATRVLVEQVMTTSVISVAKDTEIREVARLLAENQISGVPVVDRDNRVLGVVTERDILCAVGMGKHHTFKDILKQTLGEPIPRCEKAGTAGEAMTSPAITTTRDTDIKEVARIMDDRRIKRLPVVDNENRIIGIVARADVVKLIAK